MQIIKWDLRPYNLPKHLTPNHAYAAEFYRKGDDMERKGREILERYQARSENSRSNHARTPANAKNAAGLRTDIEAFAVR
jgi:hypothetical protein